MGAGVGMCCQLLPVLGPAQSDVVWPFSFKSKKLSRVAGVHTQGQSGAIERQPFLRGRHALLACVACC
uniref:Putative secreted protein n=1 Tax=Amblyomma cajennense TaxID=34607 RepID=A0A023FCZ0_AMBCJ